MGSRPFSLLAMVVVVFFLCVPTVGLADDDDLRWAEKTLTDAGLKTDSSALLGFFRQRTLSETQRSKLAQTVRQLGDPSFRVREQASEALIAAGRTAVPYLRDALKDPDLEIARRAERCLEVIESGSDVAFGLAAVRLLAKRQPAGTVEALLAYLPFCADGALEEQIIESLAETGTKNGKADPALQAALKDKEPARRAAAAAVLGRSASADQRQPVQKLLTDPSPKVRFRAAMALVGAGDKQAVPSLVALLNDSPGDEAYLVEEVLCRLAGDGRPNAILELTNPEARKKCRDAWLAWWKANETKIDAGRLKQQERYLGLTLIADLDRGQIIEVGMDHKERWHVSGFQGPVDMHLLSNGHVLVAENHGSRVTERDRNGKIIWEKRTASLPGSCQRLPNGNTFIATNGQIIEVKPDGKEVYQWTVNGGVWFAQKLRNGHSVVVTGAGRVVTLDAAGKEIKGFDTGGVTSWSSVEVLPNGHVLVCKAGVTEYDSSGNEVWKASVPNAVCATRAANGHTLVCDSEGRRILELDRAGKTVWEHKLEGRPWHVRRR